MEKYSHKRRFTVLFSDTDFKDDLKVSSLLDYAQEAACSSADELGFGYDDLKPLGYGFLVVNTVVELRRPIKLSEEITVETWPLTPRRCFFERHYRLTGGEGELAAVASRWCFFDLVNSALLSPDRLPAHESCPYRDDKAIERPDYRIPKLGDDAGEVYRRIVRYSDCDHYFHANNARYADFFFDCFTADELSENPVKRVRISYSKQVKEGEEIIFYRKQIGGETVIEARSGGEICTQFAVTFQGEPS